MMNLMNGIYKTGYGIRKNGLRPISRLGKWIIRRGLPMLPSWLDRQQLCFEDLLISYSLKHHMYPNIYQLYTGEYEPFTMKLFRDSIESGMTVLDIGAHIGIYSLLAAAQMSSGGQVLAFEPDPRNLAFLEENVKINGFTDLIRIVPKAVCETEKKALLYLSQHTGLNSLIHSSNPRPKALEIDAISMDSFLDKIISIDVIKMDIEGAEIYALQGMQRTLERTNANLKLFLELNPGSLQQAGCSVEAFFSKLREFKLEIQIIDETNRQLIAVDTNADQQQDLFRKGYANLYCTRK